MEKISIKAYAKINLYLDVTGRRADGYHLLETVMHSVSLCDIVTLEKQGCGITIACSDSSIPCDERNIAYKCADAFFKKTGIADCGIYINIEKNIPSQAGMGGGSADGAAVLCGMNRLFNAGLTERELCAIAAPLGADIPFCIIGGCGYCTGIGEIIEPLMPVTCTVLIGKGTQGISTALAYSQIDEKGVSVGLSGVKSAFSDITGFSDIADFCRNVFEEAVSNEEISDIKSIMLSYGSVSSCMTGSGSAVFGLFDDTQAADNAAKALKDKGYFSAVCGFYPKGYDII